MARIGLKNAKYNKIDRGTNKYNALTDGKIPVLKGIIESKFSPEFNSAELYADDVLAESDYTYKKGTLSLVVADDDDDVCAELLGNTVSTDKEVSQKITDEAPEVGFGHVVTKKVNGVLKYKVEFFPRVKFTKVTTDSKTRGESVEFNTTSIEGTVMPLDADINGIEAGTWEKHQTFATEAEAVAYLDKLLTPISE